MDRSSAELKNITYELFIVALSGLSLINLVLILLFEDVNLVISGVVFLMDLFFSLIFLADFLYRLSIAPSRVGYIVRQFGWADFLSCVPLPPAKILRTFRIFYSSRLMRKHNIRHVLREFLVNRAGSSLFALLFFIILTLEFGGMAMVAAESISPDASIRTPGDAIWYIYVTITTVGYGDLSPVTSTGRVMGIVIMTIGVALYATLTGYLTNAFLAPSPKKPEAAPPATDNDPKAKIAELKQWLEEQQQAQQAALEAKLEEIERLL